MVAFGVVWDGWWFELRGAGMEWKKGLNAKGNYEVISAFSINTCVARISHHHNIQITLL